MPQEEKTEVGNEVSVRIGQKFFEDSKTDFLAFIEDLQKRMADRGLTQEKLDEILNEK